MSGKIGSSALVWIKVVQWCGRKGRVVLMVSSEEFDRKINQAEKLFDWMEDGGLVGRSSNLEFLPDFC